MRIDDCARGFGVCSPVQGSPRLRVAPQDECVRRVERQHLSAEIEGGGAALGKSNGAQPVLEMDLGTTLDKICQAGSMKAADRPWRATKGRQARPPLARVSRTTAAASLR